MVCVLIRTSQCVIMTRVVGTILKVTFFPQTCDTVILAVRLLTKERLHFNTRGVQYVLKTTQYIPKFYIYTLHIYFH